MKSDRISSRKFNSKLVGIKLNNIEPKKSTACEDLIKMTSSKCVINPKNKLNNSFKTPLTTD